MLHFRELLMLRTYFKEFFIDKKWTLDLFTTLYEYYNTWKRFLNITLIDYLLITYIFIKKLFFLFLNVYIIFYGSLLYLRLVFIVNLIITLHIELWFMFLTKTSRLKYLGHFDLNDLLLNILLVKGISC